MLRLEMEGRITANRQQKPYFFGAEASGFLEYLRTERGLRERTVRHYLHGLNRLGNYLERVGVTSLGNSHQRCWHLSSSTLLPPYHAPVVAASAATSRLSKILLPGTDRC
jgi:hypothetical protein